MSIQSFFSPQVAEQTLLKPLSELRRALHEHPELSAKETKTTERLRVLFDQPPFEILPLPLETGLVVRIRGNGSGRRVAVRGDIDALPVEEWSGNPIRSLNPGVMHACGHDLHTSFVCGAGLLLAEARNRFPGEVLLLFQPSEETVTGAQKMLDAGLLEQYPLDAVIGGHVKPELSAGKISIRDGAVMAAKDGFRIDVIGKGGHGACPQDCIDPIVAAAVLITSLQTVVSRTSIPSEAGVLSVCSIHGGTTDNVVPDSVTLLGSLRTTSNEQRASCLHRMRAVAKHTGEAMGCEIRIVETPGTPVLENDPKVTRLCRAAVRALLGDDRVTALPVDTISEDFSLFSERVPACFIGVGTAEPGKEIYPLHSSRFFPSDRVLPIGAAVYAEMAIALLKAD